MKARLDLLIRNEAPEDKINISASHTLYYALRREA